MVSCLALALPEGLSDPVFDATAALSVAGHAALINARDNIQNHGAMGFTEEHSAPRYVKRAHVLIGSLGPAAGICSTGACWASAVPLAEMHNSSAKLLVLRNIRFFIWVLPLYRIILLSG